MGNRRSLELGGLERTRFKLGSAAIEFSVGKGLPRLTLEGGEDAFNVHRFGDGSTVVVHERTGDASNDDIRKVRLQVPEGYLVVSHTIRTKAGQVLLEGVNARTLSIASEVGNVVMRGVYTRGLTIATTSGDIEARNVVSPEPVKVSTESGHIELERVGVPEWQVRTVRCDVTAHDVNGTLNVVSSAGGRVLVRGDAPN